MAPGWVGGAAIAGPTHISPMPARLDPVTAAANPELSALVGSLSRACGLAQALKRMAVTTHRTGMQLLERG